MTDDDRVSITFRLDRGTFHVLRDTAASRTGGNKTAVARLAFRFASMILTDDTTLAITPTEDNATAILNAYVQGRAS